MAWDVQGYVVRPWREEVASESHGHAASAASTGDLHRQASTSTAAIKRHEPGSPATEPATVQQQTAATQMVSPIHIWPPLPASPPLSLRKWPSDTKYGTALASRICCRIPGCMRSRSTLHIQSCICGGCLQDQERQLAALLSMQDLSGASLLNSAEGQGSSNLIYILKTLQVHSPSHALPKHTVLTILLSCLHFWDSTILSVLASKRFR